MPEATQDTPPDSDKQGRRQRQPLGANEMAALSNRLGGKQALMRYARHALLLVVILLGIWAARSGLGILPAEAVVPVPSDAVTPEPTSVALLNVAQLPVFTAAGGPLAAGIARAVEVHTERPDRPRMDIIKYTVQQGDTVFGIAEKFGLKPETILWGNYDVLKDDPHSLAPGQQLNILPVDGTYYVWNEGDGLSGVAKFFGVTAQDIIDWPGNNIDPEVDPNAPGIAPGTALVIPNGHRELVTWSAPRITRANPGVAKILGPGACGAIYDGPVGTGSFIWPTPLHYLSGYAFSSVHPAIDLAGHLGTPISASDTGVVVYAGWNDWGYGNVIVLDHGNGWQTLYAHLSQINVVCGQAVFQGNIIGLMGATGNATGPHLHFEMMSDKYGKVNAFDFLP
jgi:murein DD-endopeptidase MepM/ murein hydrolase activator NlpD